MLLGPIVHSELIKIARQKRWYVLRVLLGLALLFLIYQSYQVPYMFRRFGGPSTFSHEELQIMSMRLFYQLMVGQAVVILFLTPALTAGAIAEEKQRKTLHYLLASRLTSLEIVVGKLGSRMLLIAIPIAISLPVMVMLGLFGGIDLNLVLAGYAAIASTALFEGSVAILISTLVRRGREALLLTFLMSLAWLFAPIILQSLMISQEEPWPARYYRWIEPVNSHLINLGPGCLMQPVAWRGGPGTLASLIVTMIGHQVVTSVMLLLLATWQVRPAFRRQDGSPVFGKGLTRSIRHTFRQWRPRRPCGDEAMIWKETHGTPGSVLLNLVSYLCVIGVGVCAFQSLKETVPNAWKSLRLNGYHVGFDSTRQELNIVLRGMSVGLFCVLGLMLAALASTSISREREDDTWISLISTPLDGRAILTAKLLGSVWALRAMIVMMICVWIFGLVMGAFHPLGVVISALNLAIFVLFILALGTTISLRTKTTMRAVGLTFGILLFLSLIVPIVADFGGSRDIKSFITSPPVIFVLGMLSYRDFGIAVSKTISFANQHEQYMIRACTVTVIVGTIGFLIASFVLLPRTYWAFDRLIDRPHRGLMSPRNQQTRTKTADRAAAEPVEIQAGQV